MNAKSLVACAALLMGVAFVAPQASAAGVQSDVVGYTTIKMDADKWYMIGTPFTALDGAKTVRINDLFRADFQTRDSMRVLDTNSNTYTVYFWNGNADGQKGAWVEKSARNPVPTEATIGPGQAVYIQKTKDAAATTLTLAGKVEATTVEFGLDTTGSWSQVVAVWPTDTALNDIVWTGMKTRDSIRILNSDLNEYSVYYWNGKAKEGQGAWVEGSSRNPTPSTRIVKAGEAMFVNKLDAGKATLLAK